MCSLLFATAKYVRFFGHRLVFVVDSPNAGIVFALDVFFLLTRTDALFKLNYRVYTSISTNYVLDKSPFEEHSYNADQMDVDPRLKQYQNKRQDIYRRSQFTRPVQFPFIRSH
jgi:hypothetical protein